MKEFNFSKNYEEFKIGGKVYKIAFDDEAIVRYRKGMLQYSDEAKELEQRKPKTEEEHEKLFNDSVKMAESLIDLLLGNGSFKELYEASGKSTEQMAVLIEWLGNFIVDKTKEKKEQKIKKYVK